MARCSGRRARRCAGVIAPDAATAEAWGDKPPKASVRASNLKIIGKNALKATVELTIPKWHLVIRGEKGDREWVAFPAAEWTDRNGTRKFSNIIEFTDRATAGQFQGAALAAVRMLERFADALSCIDQCFIADDMLEQLPTASRVGKTIVGGIDLNKTRMRGVLEALIALSASPNGFTASQVAARVCALTKQSPSQYGPRHAAYDLKKLRGKHIMCRIGHTRRYEPLLTGLRAMTTLLGLWTIPAQRMKGGGRMRCRSLAPETMALLRRLPRFAGEGSVFATRCGAKPVNGFSKAKKRIDKLSGVAGWVIHDLRRMMRTHLSALPVQDLPFASSLSRMPSPVCIRFTISTRIRTRNAAASSFGKLGCSQSSCHSRARTWSGFRKDKPKWCNPPSGARSCSRYLVTDMGQRQSVVLLFSNWAICGNKVRIQCRRPVRGRRRSPRDAPRGAKVRFAR